MLEDEKSFSEGDDLLQEIPTDIFFLEIYFLYLLKL